VLGERPARPYKIIFLNLNIFVRGITLNENKQGCVYFVGAGAGDPGLLTLKGRDLIAAADVIVYAGSLVNPATLAHAKPEAKRLSSAGMKLDEQVAVMKTAVSQQKTVVRLHTGDPSIYGAIFEQMRRLRESNVPFEIVPGVSSGLAAAAALGIEYTLPGDTQTVIFTRQSGRTPVPDRGIYAVWRRTALVLSFF